VNLDVGAIRRCHREIESAGFDVYLRFTMGGDDFKAHGKPALANFPGAILGDDSR
jgi:hypothetical protein